MLACDTWAQSCPGPPPRSSSPRCSLALVSNSSHSSLRVFRHLRALSFFGSQLSRVLLAVCALFCKKPGVHPHVFIPRLCCRLQTVGCRPVSGHFLYLLYFPCIRIPASYLFCF